MPAGEPRDLIDRLESLYGVIRHVDFDAEAHATDKQALFDTGRREDWLLFLSRI